jgi:DNA sulfur modification protein DndE
MRQTRLMLLAFLFLVAHGGLAQQPSPIASELAALCHNLPFVMPSVPVPSFPDRSVTIVQHGAIADGVTLNTKAFALAIDACAQAGGGTVVVPAGTWLTGPIGLQSNIRLHLERGALVQFSSRIEDFPLIAGFDGKSQRYFVTPPLYAFRASNIAITGEGVFDGAGEVWRYVKKDKLTARQWKDLVASGGAVTPDGKEWWPSREAMEAADAIQSMVKAGSEPTREDYARLKEYLRPDLLRLEQCTSILIDGPTFENSPKFHIHPIQCENIIIRDTKVLTEWYAQNGDGIDLSACRNAFVYRTTVNVGDDGLCLKPGTIGRHQTPGPACENIVIADCIVYHAHGGFVIGSESYGGARNVSVKNCQFIGTDVGIRCKSLRTRGGVIEKIWIDGIQMRAIGSEAILFDMYYGGNSPDAEAEKSQGARRAEPVDDRTPQFRDFYIRNVVCNGAARAVVVNGLPEMPVRTITMENISIASVRGVSLVDAEGIRFTRCRIVPSAGSVFAMQDSRDVTITGGTYPAGVECFLSVEGEGTSHIQLDGVDSKAAKEQVRLGKNVNTNAVVRTH